MASLSRFSDVSEEELNAFIRKAVQEKSKIARKYGIKNFKSKKKKEFEVSISLFHSMDSCWCMISIGCLNKFNSCFSKKCRSFVFSSEILLKQLE